MTNGEWIELFFSESFEKQINEMILEDWDYEIPCDSILNYVKNIIEIPYNEFLIYVTQIQDGNKFTANDVPEFVKFEHCTSGLINFIIEENNRGFKASEIGARFNDTFQKTMSADITYALRHLYTANILGIVYEYYGSWYGNCLIYVYDKLQPAEKKAMMARCILRNPFYAKLLAYLTEDDVSLINMLDMYSPKFVYRRLAAICSLSDICISQTREQDLYLGIIQEQDPRYRYLSIRGTWLMLRRYFSMDIEMRKVVDDYILPYNQELNLEEANRLVMRCFDATVRKDIDDMTNHLERTMENWLWILNQKNNRILIYDNLDNSGFSYHNFGVNDKPLPPLFHFDKETESHAEYRKEESVQQKYGISKDKPDHSVNKRHSSNSRDKKKSRKEDNSGNKTQKKYLFVVQRSEELTYDDIRFDGEISSIVARDGKIIFSAKGMLLIVEHKLYLLCKEGFYYGVYRVIQHINMEYELDSFLFLIEKSRAIFRFLDSNKYDYIKQCVLDVDCMQKKLIVKEPAGEGDKKDVKGCGLTIKKDEHTYSYIRLNDYVAYTVECDKLILWKNYGKYKKWFDVDKKSSLASEIINSSDLIVDTYTSKHGVRVRLTKNIEDWKQIKVYSRKGEFVWSNENLKIRNLPNDGLSSTDKPKNLSTIAKKSKDKALHIETKIQNQIIKSHKKTINIMIKKGIELIGNEKYAGLKTLKIKGLCQRYHLAVLTEYTYEIALFKATNPDPDQVKHPGNKIFKAEIAIKLFYETYKEELDMIKGCKEEMENFYKAFTQEV